MIKKIFFHLVGLFGTFVFALIFIVIFANSVQMVCQRQPETGYHCMIEKKLLGRVSISQRTLNGVTGARTVQSCDSDGCAYRTELTTTNGGSEPFDDVYTDHDPVAQITNQINASIQQDDGKSFNIVEPMQLWVLLLIGGLALMGLGIQAIIILTDVFRWATGRR